MGYFCHLITHELRELEAEGAVTWGRTGFFYDKRSEFCEKEELTY